MTKLEKIDKTENLEEELFKKYIDLIVFMECAKLNVKAVINFLYIHYEIIAKSQETFEEDVI